MATNTGKFTWIENFFLHQSQLTSVLVMKHMKTKISLIDRVSLKSRCECSWFVGYSLQQVQKQAGLNAIYSNSTNCNLQILKDQQQQRQNQL